MSFPNNIILVGLMGAGKTTVGRMLAKHLGMRFIDSDHEIERRTGVKIPLIFELEGEEGFRNRETAVLSQLCQMDNVVLATGGGAVLREENCKFLKHSGIVVYLRAQVRDLYHRTRHDKNRPLLQTADPQAKLRELYGQRDPIYRQLADIIMDTGEQNLHVLVRRLIQKLTDGHASNMQTLTVDLGARSYPIHIGAGLLQQAQLLLPHLAQKRVAIVTNTTVAPLYLEQLSNTLTQQGVSVLPIILPDGEAYKNSETLNQIYNALLENRCERKTTLIALGGGVIGDLTGYAAASFLRGVPFIQVPTTLLSQVDSSVGGKTGINHPLGKNMIGAFYQPQVVLADTSTLDTLPARELAAGLAEVIKYGLIRDLPFFEWLEKNMDRLLARDKDALAYAIRRSCENKAEIVALDEHEGGVRALLNLGHTFGHAIEAGMGYGNWLHGEAVAGGTVLAVDLSRRMGWLSEEDVERTRRLFQRAGLPDHAPDLGVEAYLDYMGLDKKVESGKIRFVLLKRIGEAFVTGDIPPEHLKDALTGFVQK